MLETLTDQLQQYVARIVPQVVIDGFETIQIDKQHGQQGRITLRMEDFMLQSFIEQQAVGQTSESIVKGQICQLQFSLLLRSHIDNREQAYGFGGVKQGLSID